MNVRHQARVTERLGGLAGRFRYRLDTRTEDLRIEGTGKKAERYHRPAEAVDISHLVASGVVSRDQVTEYKIEKQDLHEWRCIAEKLDIPGYHVADDLGFCPLRPGTDKTNHETENQACGDQLE